MDFIGQVHPASNKGHTFIIVAMDYFTKWVESSAVKTITSATVKKFIETKILHIFEVPEIIVTDHVLSFISKEVEEFAKKWHEKLGDTLWACRTSKRAGTGTTPYSLTFGQDAVIPMEINVSSVRIQNQYELHSEEYIQAMCQGIEDLDIARIEALNKIQEGKRVVA
ncbi:uncharacterized protein [Malus domestica]|uniref:uncharacterized protein n=1 Tax=Malus domestica TaxID=3750 RepID=UPI000498AEB0|nr:uncharacterized protein LOC103434019 [Malus domestica]